ncbi:hypothetical protein BDV12DRAFT_110178 [Aspergillus spectabilis]
MNATDRGIFSPQARTIVDINLRHESGRGEEESLRAPIDDDLDGNIIRGAYFEQLQQFLKLERIPLHSPTVLRDSHGVSYTLQSKVELFIGQTDEPRTDTSSFYILENEDTPLAGGYQVLLARGWKEKFRLPRDDGKKTLSAAPSVVHHSSPQEREKWKEQAPKNREQKRREALEKEAGLKKEQEDKNRQSGQSTSTTR